MPIEIRELIVEGPSSSAEPPRPAPVQPRTADVARTVAAVARADAVRHDRRRAD